MPRSDPGSSPARRTPRRGPGPRGFTLIEVMVVVALIAIAVGVASLSLRDSRSTRLEREAARLSALLETARAEARVSGLPVRFQLSPGGGERQFSFIGLPASRTMPTRWLDGEVVALIGNDRPVVVLGPEALIGPQSVTLRIDDHRIEIGTDGLRPFTVLSSTSGGPP